MYFLNCKYTEFYLKSLFKFHYSLWSLLKQKKPLKVRNKNKNYEKFFIQQKLCIENKLIAYKVYKTKFYTPFIK